jgi:hypothetical protein
VSVGIGAEAEWRGSIPAQTMAEIAHFESIVDDVHQTFGRIELGIDDLVSAGLLPSTVNWAGILQARERLTTARVIDRMRRTGRGSGHDVVDHPRGAHDDIINAAAGALTLAALGPRPLRITNEMVAAARARPPRGLAGYRDPLTAFAGRLR